MKLDSAWWSNILLQPLYKHVYDQILVGWQGEPTGAAYRLLVFREENIKYR